MVNYQLQPKHWLNIKPIWLFSHVSTFNFCMTWRWSNGPTINIRSISVVVCITTRVFPDNWGPDLNQWFWTPVVAANMISAPWIRQRIQPGERMWFEVNWWLKSKPERKTPEVMQTFRTSTTACLLVLAVTHQRPWRPFFFTADGFDTSGTNG